MLQITPKDAVEAAARPPETPAIRMAQDALGAMTEPQRMAVALQIVAKVHDINCVIQLHRMTRLAQDVATGLEDSLRTGRVG